MIYVYGLDPFDYSPSSKSLYKELKRAGFKRSELVYLDSDDPLPVRGYVLCFGSSPFKVLTASEHSLGVCRGDLFLAAGQENLLVFPTFAPGYLYRNPNVIPVFREDLQTFRAFIKLDKDGEVV